MIRLDVSGIELCFFSDDEQVRRTADELEAAYGLDGITFFEDNVAVDVGAHRGVVSLWLAKRYPAINVYAIEPEPENFKELTWAKWKNEADNLVCLNEAITGDGRDLTIYYGAHTGEASAFADLETPQHQGRGSFETRSATMLDLMNDMMIDRIRFLKLDCEGAEHEIIQHGMVTGWIDRVDHIAGEIHLNRPLREMGYKLTETMKAGGRWQICES